MNENLKRVNGILLLVIIAVGGFSFWQIYIRTNAINEQNQLLTQYQADNQALENDVNMYLDFIGDLETRITPDDVMAQNQEGIIRDFILAYYTFVSGEEELRVLNSARYVTDDMLQLMSDALAEEPGGNYHLALTASNITLYRGRANEFLATFEVFYESDITRDMTQIFAVRFVMNDLLIDDFRILSASEVFDFE